MIDVGVTVSVEYGDMLGVTLPRNALHFERVFVATVGRDRATLDVIASVPNALPVVTDAFYRGGAWFNKGLAVEETLDAADRRAPKWFCCFDADILMPARLPLPRLRADTLYAPWRKILADPSRWQDYTNPASWRELPRYEETWEFAGAFLLFNSRAPHLRDRQHWFGRNWRHAGGYDSDFYYAWPKDKRHRMEFDVLHLGDHGQNWFGRRTPSLDGDLPEEAEERGRLMDALPSRRAREGYGWEKL